MYVLWFDILPVLGQINLQLSHVQWRSQKIPEEISHLIIWSTRTIGSLLLNVSTNDWNMDSMAQSYICIPAGEHAVWCPFETCWTVVNYPLSSLVSVVIDVPHDPGPWCGTYHTLPSSRNNSFVGTLFAYPLVSISVINWMYCLCKLSFFRSFFLKFLSVYMLLPVTCCLTFWCFSAWTVKLFWNVHLASSPLTLLL